MLHPDGRLMTENLRKARATDFYTLRGDRERRDLDAALHLSRLPVRRADRPAGEARTSTR